MSIAEDLNLTPLPRKALALGAPPTQPPTTPEEHQVIKWDEKDWYWLGVYKQIIKEFPDDFITRMQYKNYLKYYANSN